MSMGHATAEGWYFKRRADLSEAKGGPYTWTDLVSYARQGVFAPDDLVWHETLPDWTRADEIAGLFSPASAGPATPVAPAPVPVQSPGAPAGPPAGPPRKGRTGLVIAMAVAALVVLVAVGGGAWWFLSRSGGVGGGGPNLGAAQQKLPDPAKLVVTEEWGEVPANQIGITLVEGGKRKHAEQVAKELGGSVVGEVEYIGAYQIEFAGATEDDLRAALAKAEASERVELAFPNQQDAIDVEIWGVRQDPYDDPIYGGGAGDGYQAIGVSKAWTYIKGSGLGLSNVKVGVVDDGLYKPGQGRESEFGGDVEIEFPDEAAGELAAPEVWDDGVTNPAGSHGTGVTTIIGADPGNGGPTGIAGPLGKKLKISMLNKYTGQYGQNVTATPDPNDPTKVTLGAKTYSFGTLVALKKQVENNAKVINCSFGKTDGHPAVAAAYKKFFEKMAVDHPDVIFVCSAGNDGKVVDGSKRFPSGHALPNMVTVGALDNDGRTAEYSNKASENYEVTLGAPGTQAVVGMGPNGGPERQDGTSFAAPHVTAAAAILKSLNPKLQAADIKRILTETARTELEVPGPGGGKASRLISPNVGGKMLAIDRAVFAVINQLRKDKGLKALSLEEMESMGLIDAVAKTGDPGEYAVRGIIKGAGEGGTDVSIDVTGEGYAIGGKSTQSLAGAGEAKWSVTLPKDEGVITVRRLDNDAASVITIERFDINGPWSGSFTITDVQVSDEDAAKEEGCSLALLSELKGKAAPMTMNINVDEGGQGSGEGLIDFASIIGEGESETQEYGVKLNGSTIDYTVKGGGKGYSMSATVKREGENLVQNGTLSLSASGIKLKAVFTLSKPDTVK